MTAKTVWMVCLLIGGELHAQVPSPAPASRDAASMQVAGGTLRVRAVTDDILHVQLLRDGPPEQGGSWAVIGGADVRGIPVTKRASGFATRTLVVTLNAAGGIRVEDPSGQLICTDTMTPWHLDGRAFSIDKVMPDTESYFGLGDKTGGLDRRGQSFVNWNTDAYGFNRATDPIYKSIPFFVAVGGAGGSYGVFLDNTWRTWFDFGHRKDGVLTLGGPDGPIDYYLIAGPATAQVVQRFTNLTGRAPLPPAWALGYQQSRYSYMSADELTGVAARLRSERIPTDMLWMDIDWLDHNRPFTVNTAAFPDLRGMLGALDRQGFKVVTITDLHVAALPNQGYAPYDSGMAGDHFVHRADGSLYIGPVWPGPSVFPEFTRESSRRWWGGLFAPQLDQGVAGVWNDMNEPALFGTLTKTMPPEVRHRIQGDGQETRVATHAEVHNVYGMLNSRATYEGLRALRPDARGFVMTRASYAGGQRYAMTWTGDNLSTWDHLKLSVQQLINLGLSGFAFSGADVSGFGGGPSAELLTRWFEIGAFYPVFRDHSSKGTPRVEPWVDGPEHLAIRRHFIEERYRLLPYLYALADEHARLGDPLLRPVFYDYPSALRMSCDQSWTFTLGRSLLVAPPPSPDSPQAYDICLPAGGWFDYWTGLAVGEAARTGAMVIQSASQATGQAQERGDIVRSTPQLEQLPVFVRAGTILPRQPLVQSTAEAPSGPLRLDVYPGKGCHGELYLDDGKSMGYTRGDYLRQSLRCAISTKRLMIEFSPREGHYPPWWSAVDVVVHGWSSDAKVTARSVIKATLDQNAKTLSFSLAEPNGARKVTIVAR